MAAYSLQLAWHNLLKDRWSTLLVVLALAVGVGASMTVYSLLQAMARDPIPHKSRQLFAPRLDSVGPHAGMGGMGARGVDKGLPEVFMAYRDAVALRDARLGLRQAVMYGTGMLVSAAEGAGATLSRVRATDGDFFAMFDVPFLAGEGWGRKEDAEGARVAVINEGMARRLFGLEDAGAARGREIILEGHVFRIIGVVRHRAPSPLFYSLGFDRTSDAYQPHDEIFVPLSAATDLLADTANAPANCARHGELTGDFPRNREDWLRGECVWVQLWVELPDHAAVQRYRRWLEDYAKEQRRSGRFDWDPVVVLLDVREFLAAYGAVPGEYRVATLLAFGFLAVCVVNAAALLLLRLRRRASDLALRHALGASRRTLFTHGLAEAGAIGVASGVLGLALAGLGILVQRRLLPPELAPLAEPDPGFLALTLGIAVMAALAAGLYPAWHVAVMRTTPGAGLRGLRPGAGRLLIATQVAATLALVVNALFIAWQKFEAVRRPTHVDEQNLFFVGSRWAAGTADIQARVARDIAGLRSLASVQAASVAAPPLLADNWGLSVSGLGWADPRPSSAAMFRVDEHTLDAWGARLVAGRWFRPEEIRRDEPHGPPPGQVVVTRSLAEREFGSAPDALGKPVYLRGGLRVTVIGVIEDVPGHFQSSAAYAQAFFVPSVHPRGGTSMYSVRALPGRIEEAMRESLEFLRREDPVRALGLPGLDQLTGGMFSGAESFARFSAYTRRADRGVALLLLVTSALLLVVAGLGIVGVAGNWMLQRREQIGVRRALGARRRDILRQFQLENLAVVVAGVMVGAVAAQAINLWLIGRFEMSRLSPLWVPAGAVVIVLLAQLAALWPALRGAMVPPATAARTR